ncbi:TIGR01459 family HAD-type hydrolase [Candidatus Halocynthiibacter alkanivorans]|uniref:TIGR01459 family HAD-type hydrolase n=1 Tax=Candidatus Halocynthiibacter alkanivorans TaxID=2267619 RepID=UPI000DF155C9|nr:TIGR01459 family HAD-type hydrolase [Candidatus Halocynthiibacter alkanivorans]
MTRIIQQLADISTNYDALFVDLWGCVHNGVTAFPGAVAALQAYRKSGGIVVLVTNSPRPRASVQEQITGMGVPQDAWDDIATSGDSARAAMFHGVVGQKVHHIGIPDETSFFAPLNVLDDAQDIEMVSLREADGIVCTGPVDSLADPEVNRADFLYAIAKGLKLLCANPDIVVDRGARREWCAGALARLYTEMGGESLYFGKPHAPIYDLARLRLAQIAQIEDDKILCIGDGIHTDVAGGIGEGFDTLFITGGLAADQFGTDVLKPEPALLDTWLALEKLSPVAAISLLR